MQVQGPDDLMRELDELIEKLADTSDLDAALDGIRLLELDLAKRDAEKLALQTTVKTLAACAALPAPEPTPVFSVQSELIVNAKQKALKPTSTYPAKLRNAARAWILLRGDHPVEYYRPSELQDFANDLARLPRNWAVTPHFRAMSYTEVVSETEQAREKARLAGKKLPDLFSQTNIKEYVAQVAHLFAHARAAYPTRVADFGGAPLTVPKSARRSVKRNPVAVENLNIWFQRAAQERRADDCFLPLLGALTGARLSELVYTRVKDVQEIHGHLCLNLIDDQDTHLAKDRPDLKTETSYRLIVLHDVLKQTGFPKWLKSLDPNSWLWPDLHRRIVRPHGTASKRMIRQMQSVGIHRPYSGVFHSLRHGTKDWHRSVDVTDRVSRQQVGHAFKDVGDSYGSKALTAKELSLLAKIPLPEGLDFSPYLALPSAHPC